MAHLINCLDIVRWSSCVTVLIDGIWSIPIVLLSPPLFLMFFSLSKPYWSIFVHHWSIHVVLGPFLFFNVSVVFINGTWSILIALCPTHLILTLLCFSLHSSHFWSILVSGHLSFMSSALMIHSLFFVVHNYPLARPHVYKLISLCSYIAVHAHLRDSWKRKRKRKGAHFISFIVQ